MRAMFTFQLTGISLVTDRALTKEIGLVLGIATTSVLAWTTLAGICLLYKSRQNRTVLSKLYSMGLIKYGNDTFIIQ